MDEEESFDEMTGNIMLEYISLKDDFIMEVHFLIFSLISTIYLTE